MNVPIVKHYKCNKSKSPVKLNLLDKILIQYNKYDIKVLLK